VDLRQLIRRRRWWRTEGLRALRLMAIEQWDPDGVYGDPAQAGVYDPFLERTGRMLRRGRSAEAIAVYLGKVRTKAFRRDENETLDREFADRVVAWYRLEAPE
jgi:hypothetical protein